MSKIKFALQYPSRFFFGNIMLTFPGLLMAIYLLLPVSPQFIQFTFLAIQPQAMNQAEFKNLATATTKGFSAIAGVFLIATVSMILSEIGESLKQGEPES